MRAEKIAIAREIKEQLGAAKFAILTDFTRMDTAKTMALRRKLREVEALPAGEAQKLLGDISVEAAGEDDAVV